MVNIAPEPKGNGSRRRVFRIPPGGHDASRSKSRRLTSRTPSSGTWKPGIALHGRRHSVVKLSYRAAGTGCRNKRMPVCNVQDRDPCLNTKVCPRPTGLLWRENLENQQYEATQMTAVNISTKCALTDAPSATISYLASESWSAMERIVYWLQIIIAKVTGKNGYRVSLRTGLSKGLSCVR